MVSGLHLQDSESRLLLAGTADISGREQIYNGYDGRFPDFVVRPNDVITFAADGYHPVEMRYDTLSRKEQPSSVLLAPLHSWTIRILRPSGMPASHAEVDAFHPESVGRRGIVGRYHWSRQADDQGRIEFRFSDNPFLRIRHERASTVVRLTKDLDKVSLSAGVVDLSVARRDFLAGLSSYLVATDGAVLEVPFRPRADWSVGWLSDREAAVLELSARQISQLEVSGAKLEPSRFNEVLVLPELGTESVAIEPADTGYPLELLTCSNEKYEGNVELIPQALHPAMGWVPLAPLYTGSVKGGLRLPEYVYRQLAGDVGYRLITLADGGNYALTEPRTLSGSWSVESPLTIRLCQADEYTVRLRPGSPSRQRMEVFSVLLRATIPVDPPIEELADRFGSLRIPSDWVDTLVARDPATGATIGQVVQYAVRSLEIVLDGSSSSLEISDVPIDVIPHALHVGSRSVLPPTSWRDGIWLVDHVPEGEIVVGTEAYCRAATLGLGSGRRLFDARTVVHKGNTSISWSPHCAVARGFVEANGIDHRFLFVSPVYFPYSWSVFTATERYPVSSDGSWTSGKPIETPPLLAVCAQPSGSDIVCLGLARAGEALVASVGSILLDGCTRRDSDVAKAGWSSTGGGTLDMVQWIEPMSYESAPRGADQLKLDLVPTYVSEIWVEFADGSRKEWPVDVAAGGVAVVTLDG